MAVAQMHEPMPNGGNNQPNGPGMGTPNSPNPRSDMPGMDNGTQAMMQRNFLHNAAENSMAETELSKLAAEKSSNDGVKKLAQQVIQDNGKLNGDLSHAANANNVPLSDNLPGRARKAEKKMQGLSGTQFDEAYLTELNGYVKNDERLSEGTFDNSSMDMRELDLQIRTMAQNHRQQIDDLAKSENLKLK